MTSSRTGLATGLRVDTGKALWRKVGRFWQREATEVYDAPLELVWLLHGNHMAPLVLEGAGCDFEGPGSNHTHGAMDVGQRCSVRYGSRQRYDYIVAELDPSVPSVELVETRGPFRTWRRRSHLEAHPAGTAVTERLTIEIGLPMFVDRRLVERLAARRATAIRRWLAMPERQRQSFPKNAKAPKQRRI